MKIAGQEIKGGNEDILVLPRNPNPIVLKGKAVQDMDLFDKLRPMPKAPGKLTKNGYVTDD